MSRNKNHMPSNSDCKGIWWRSSDYRKRALKGIKTKSERLDVYNNEKILKATLSTISPKPTINSRGDIINIDAGSSEHISRYKLNEFVKGNKPYPNHAHHLIPANAFIRRFSEEQKNIFRMLEYDVNNGNNLIFLPATLASTHYHLLPWHQTNDFHQEYSDEVRNAATKIENKINKLIDSEDPCTRQNPPKDIVEELIKYENLLWNLVIGLGPKSINNIEIPRTRI